MLALYYFLHGVFFVRCGSAEGEAVISPVPILDY
jgi:hypothetical protein